MAIRAETLMRSPNRWSIALIGAMMTWLYVPVVLQLIQRWQEPDASHGPLIPLIGTFLIWQRREVLKSVPRGRSWPGLLLLAVAMVCYSLGTLADALFFSAVGLVLSVQGLALYLGGWPFCKRILFPLLFLFFMIPWPETALGSLSWRLQQTSIAYLNTFLGLVGLFPHRQGTTLSFNSAGHGNIQFEVAPACSGIHSLLALMALSAVFGYLTQAALLWRIGIFLAGIPLALISNLTRLILVALVGYQFGQAPMKKFHDYSDPFLFFFASCGLLLLKRIPERRSKESASPNPDAQEGIHPLPAANYWLAAVPLGIALVVRSLALAPVTPIKPDLKALPAVLGAWHQTGADDTLTDRERELLTPDDYVSRTYRHEQTRWPIFLSVIYGHRKNTFHDPTFCMQGGGFQIMNHRKITLEVENSGIPWNVFEGSHENWKPSGRNALVLFVYLNGDRPTTDLFVMNGRLLWDRVWHRKAAGVLVRVIVPTLGYDAVAYEMVKNFINQMYPELLKRLKTGS